mgnify:CR=1 FL=1
MITPSSGNAHQEKLDERKIRFISILSFIFGFTDAFFIYIISSYFSEVVGSDSVGAFYLVAFSIVLTLLWWLHRIIRKIGGSIRAFFLFILMAVVLGTVLSALQTGWVGALCIALLLIVSNIAWVILDVILEEHSSDGATGRVRGLHLTIMNAGLLLAPFLSTRVVDIYGFSGVFFGITLGYALLFAAAILFLRNGRTYTSAKMDASDAWRKMLRQKNLLRIYGISFALEFFYVIMIIYSPIYLRSIGVSWGDIGILFTFMLLPFVLFQYPLGVLADKRFGEKEFLVLSLALGAVSVAVLGIFPSADLLFLGAVLFLTRIGAAGIEVLRDAYFYKQIDGGDDDLIAFFRTARPTANILGAVVAIPFLAVFPLQGIFLLAAFMLGAMVIPALALDDTPGERESTGIPV